ncbi:MAG: sugar transferase [Chloroflexota bacterium]|nr:sugar transferase [Chloroflexota bacterium]
MDQFTNYSTTITADTFSAAPGATGARSRDLERDEGSRIDPSWQAILEELQRRGASSPPVSRLQRLVEIPVAAVLLILTFPLMLLIALLVRLDSPGPTVFRQIRVGRNGRLFRFAKFRTLYVDARQRWPHLYAYRYTADEVAALHFKLKDDPRVTRAGRWLRKSTLDELPNLWNVLVGDVALVGPRPEIPEMLPYYDTEALAKFSVRPGVTGLAQVSGRGDLNFRDTVAYDLAYVRQRSWHLDLEVLTRTVICTVLRKGAF